MGDNDVHSLHAVSTITTGPGRDRIWTGDDADVIDAGDGNNIIQSGGGADTIRTGAGQDSIQAGSGNDRVWAGAGNDSVDGGAGDDVLVGEAGHDDLVGGQDRDILIGGTGADRIVGDAGDDILIAGYTLFDSDAAALTAFQAEWSSGLSYAQRTARLLAGTAATGGRRLNGDDGVGQTVFNDSDIDTLIGRAGQDWFLANRMADNGGPLDKVTDLALSELFGDTDF